ncbi:MAG: helix-turn-helix transcriptional regulator [Alcanivoracaceae bacterium]|nr:helix-turn-helix transcriptional regulator [Alcanivoracaceae bacterium]
MKTKHSYSRYSSDAIYLLGKLIRAERKQKKITTIELAERAGIFRSLLQRIEKGDPKCSIGAVFEAATIVGIQLFNEGDNSLHKHIYRVEKQLTLLPQSIRHTKTELIDDF